MSADLEHRCLQACNIGKTFTLHPQGGTQLDVLNNVELVVEAGECVALVGPSGAGKSTLLRCLYGNYAPTTGRVLVRHVNEWIDLTAASPAETLAVRKTTMGWVSQFLRVIPRTSALEIVAEPVLHAGSTRTDALERAALLLRQLNVPERMWPLAPATFSGGEQQRVNVARGLAAQHPVLLVDEPTASLDPKNRDVVIELLTQARHRGTAIVGIFHDEEVRQAVATRCLLVAPIDFPASEALVS